MNRGVATGWAILNVLLGVYLLNVQLSLFSRTAFTSFEPMIFLVAGVLLILAGVYVFLRGRSSFSSLGSYY